MGYDIGTVIGNLFSRGQQGLVPAAATETQAALERTSSGNLTNKNGGKSVGGDKYDALVTLSAVPRHRFPTRPSLDGVSGVRPTAYAGTEYRRPAGVRWGVRTVR